MIACKMPKVFDYYCAEIPIWYIQPITLLNTEIFKMLYCICNSYIYFVGNLRLK